LSRRALWAGKEAADRTVWRWRRACLLARVRTHAFWKRAHVSLDVAPDLRLGRGVRIEVTPRSRNLIRIGRGCSLGDRTLWALDGGEVVLGEWVDLRRDALFRVSGRLVFEGRHVLQPGLAIHCDGTITFKELASTGERTTLSDSVHYYTEPDVWGIDNLKRGSIVLGYNTMIFANATIGRNVTVGDFSMVGANSLLLTDLPSGHMATGVPATEFTPVRLPWLDPENELPSDAGTADDVGPPRGEGAATG
jgi:acetyltransferase-like isoleucine patch superfamily enzyme